MSNLKILKPRWLIIAEQELERGVKEIPGAGTNPRIEMYLKAVKGNEYTSDEVAWCAAGGGWCLENALFPSTESLLAISYESYGRALKGPQLGAICVLKRGTEDWMRHMGFIEDWDETRVKLISGNVNDQWSIDWYPRSKVTAYRWPLTIETVITGAPKFKKKRLEYIGLQEAKIENTELRIKVPWYANPKLVGTLKALVDIMLGILSAAPKTSLIGLGLIRLKNLFAPEKELGWVEFVNRLFELVKKFLTGLKSKK